MGRSVSRATLVALLVYLASAPVALAHAELKTATPGPDDVVIGSPPELVATFSQDLDPSRTSLEVRDTSGARVTRGGELGNGPREFRLDLPELTPGEYEVRWTSFSAEDGELARGSYTFTVVAAPTPSPTPTPTAIPSPSASSPSSPTPAPTVPTVTPVPAPDASAGTDPGSDTAGTDGSVLIPISAALLVVGGIGFWLLRRRAV